MRNEIMVSVIIPIYNTEKYLRECLDSVVGQTLCEIEIICVNDGSTDGSLEIIKEYQISDPRVIVFDKENGGQSSARNLGMKYARGKYIQFLDSDDMLVPSALEELLCYAEKHSLDLLFFDADSFFETDELKKAFSNHNGCHAKYDYSMPRLGAQLLSDMENTGDYHISPCLQLARQEHLNRHQLVFPDGIIHEDNLYMFQNLLLAESAARINRPYYLRRIREGSTMTMQKTYRHLYGYLKCFIEMIAFVEKQSFEKDIEMSARRIIISTYHGFIKLYKELSCDEKAKLKLLTPLEEYWMETAEKEKCIQEKKNVE